MEAHNTRVNKEAYFGWKTEGRGKRVHDVRVLDADGNLKKVIPAGTIRELSMLKYQEDGQTHYEKAVRIYMNAPPGEPITHIHRPKMKRRTERNCRICGKVFMAISSGRICHEKTCKLKNAMLANRARRAAKKKQREEGKL